jgi:predicted nucleic acid-binding protein
MRVVSDTSPLSNLAIIGRLELLKRRYGEVLIPPVVGRELAALSHVEGKAAIEEALANGWLKVHAMPEGQPLVANLDPGEEEAIRLWRDLPADKLILDDSLARQAARALGARMTGLLGELVHAKRRGHVAMVSDEIHRLRKEARFFVSREIELIVLAEAGELPR